MKHAEEIMKILEAFDLTQSYRAAGELADCDHHTVAQWVARRDVGELTATPVRRQQLIDGFLPKVEEWMEASNGKIRADVAHDKLVAMGFVGSERTTRRAVARVRAAWLAGHRRVHRPWVPEPGLWFQWDFGAGPLVGGVASLLFCAWLAWSRFRVVLPIRDKSLPTVIGCIDTTLRRFGGCSTYALTDNEKTVTVEHVARVAIRNPDIVAAAGHYLLTELRSAFVQLEAHVGDPPLRVGRLLDSRPHDQRAGAVEGPGCLGGASDRPAGRHGRPVGALSACRRGRGGGGGGGGLVRRSAGEGPFGGDGPLVWNGPAAVVPVSVGGRCVMGAGNAWRGPRLLPVVAGRG